MNTRVLLGLCVVLCGCGKPAPSSVDAGKEDVPVTPLDAGEPDAGPPQASSVVIDPTVLPRQPGTAERPLAAMEGLGGAHTELVANELLILTDDDAQVQAFLTKYAATEVRTVRFSEVGLAMPALHHVRVGALANVDTTLMPGEIDRLNPAHRDTLRVTDEAVLRLLAVAAHETRPGFVVNLNPLLELQGLTDGTSYEATDASKGDYASEYAGPYDHNAFNWPYMTSGSPQNIGVGDAWRFLAAENKLGQRVRLLIIDGGFLRHDDLPPGTVMLSSWDVPNAASCDGTPCPWHGTGVASAAASLVNNSVGTAGSGGPVVKLYLGQVAGEVNDVGDFVARFFETLKSLVTISGALGTVEPLIINMSASLSVTSWLDPLISATWGGLSAAFRAKGVMFVAAAGNDGEDVDRESSFLGIDTEPTLTIPCELGNVFCVGGMQSGNLYKHARSAWGSDGDVDLFGPFVMWTVDTDRVVNGRAMGAKLGGGTSYSAPFVAGVAALVRAADPSLSPGDVERILVETANVSPDPRVRRGVNAGEAVRRALGPGRPRIISWPQTRQIAILNQVMKVTLNATTSIADEQPNIDAYNATSLPMQLSLESSLPDTVAGDRITFTSLGVRRVKATVTDVNGAFDFREFEVEVRLPEARLFAVLGSSLSHAHQTIYGEARAFNRAGDGTFTDAACSRIRWDVPFRQLPLGGRTPVGSVVTEIDTDPVVLGQYRATARGCHAQLSLDAGSHGVHVVFLAVDGTTVQYDRYLTVNVDPRTDTEAATLGAFAFTDEQGTSVVNPGELGFFINGVFDTARYVQVQYADPGDPGIDGLSYTAVSLNTAATQSIAVDVTDQLHPEEGVLPTRNSTSTPWPGTWLMPEPEPAVIAVLASVTDRGITATRPALIRLRRGSIIP